MTEIKCNHRDKKEIFKIIKERIETQIDYIDSLDKNKGCDLLITARVDVVR